MAETTKRKADDEATNEDEVCIGPMPDEAVKQKKRKVLEYEQVYLDNMPNAEYYELSYMHREAVTHVACAKNGFIITTSNDGHVKFWKKNEEEGIEFVKHFRSHLGAIVDMNLSVNGEYCCTVADDKTAKVFDVVNFDMINMLKLGYQPKACAWIFAAGDAIAAMAVSEDGTNNIHVYDGTGTSTPLHTVDKLHYKPVTHIKYNPVYEAVVSLDSGGMLEVWTGPKYDYNFPKTLNWQYKTDTDLYDFMKCKSLPTSVSFSPDGKLMATIATDKKVRIFRFATGKLTKVLDETIKQYNEVQEMKQVLPSMEFARRLAVEKEFEKSESFSLSNIIFDESGNFILYATMLGIKVINLYTNQCVRFIGKPENIRFVQLAMFQGTGKKAKAAVDVDMVAADNPLLQNTTNDPIIFTTAHKKNRFYMFSRREASDSRSVCNERDIFNEKPSKEEIVAATQDVAYTSISDHCILHTTMGDIHIKLFHKECPKTVENFCVHSRNSYFNNHVFHRVIKGFMIQTGDPAGNGTGGESIWGGEFEDEFHPTLRHDRPYTCSMANAGPNTNGSQFFITLVPTPWLDNKHTVFGRVIKGMEVIQNIGNVKTNAKTDKPYDDIRIINVSVK
ncbi:peptidylprolyl isomerase domain and WD repeat-containing protein 1 [Patella vulgata]|uniref:peptidylprolyl isomerase domain and WD repeat-containing protein 1 n=1 Tax=Patella vulgata TaxID=6465 RepID=UPI0024A8D3D8|nr:peptidylprolyl isomerase domain and WD repeat-containing protein 1 [Patella vulgata]